MIDTLPPSAISHTQPLPKRPAPALPHSVLKLSKLPNAALIASAALPVGAPPALGAIHVQNMLWFQCPPPLLRTAVRMASGTLLMPRHRSSMLLPCSSGCLLERGIQVGDVRLMMLPVMDLHRLRVDVRLERGEVVWELWQFVSHSSSYRRMESVLQERVSRRV